MKASIKLILVHAFMLAILVFLSAIALDIFPAFAPEKGGAFLLTTFFSVITCTLLLIGLGWYQFFSKARVIPQWLINTISIAFLFLALSIFGSAGNGVIVLAVLIGLIIVATLFSMYVILDKGAEEKMVQFKEWKQWQGGEATPFVVERKRKAAFSNDLIDPEEIVFGEEVETELHKQKNMLSKIILVTLAALAVVSVVSVFVYDCTPYGEYRQEMTAEKIENQAE